jgi:hypothetical protein
VSEVNGSEGVEARAIRGLPELGVNIDCGSWFTHTGQCPFIGPSTKKLE